MYNLNEFIKRRYRYNLHIYYLKNVYTWRIWSWSKNIPKRTMKQIQLAIGEKWIIGERSLRRAVLFSGLLFILGETEIRGVSRWRRDAKHLSPRLFSPRDYAADSEWQPPSPSIIGNQVDSVQRHFPMSTTHVFRLEDRRLIFRGLILVCHLSRGEHEFLPSSIYGQHRGEPGTRNFSFVGEKNKNKKS